MEAWREGRKEARAKWKVFLVPNAFFSFLLCYGRGRHRLLDAEDFLRRRKAMFLLSLSLSLTFYRARVPNTS